MADFQQTKATVAAVKRLAAAVEAGRPYRDELFLLSEALLGQPTRDPVFRLMLRGEVEVINGRWAARLVESGRPPVEGVGASCGEALAEFVERWAAGQTRPRQPLVGEVPC